ncbi:MAG: hypothetical protein PUA72_09060 [Lachnospiraceae bacterium]|nr:hypothetical protein [Lachnospiraceae bacterium]
MERNEMVEQILSRVMEKLAAAGETVTEAELMQTLSSAAAPLPGLLVLTQEHGTDCHKLLESPRIKEKYRTGCALLNEGETTLDGIEAVVLFNLTTEAMCKLASGITDTPYTKLAAQALLMGKKLYVPREEVELYKYPVGGLGSYQCMLQAQLTKLVSFGLKICPLDQLEDCILGEASCEAAPELPKEEASCGTSEACSKSEAAEEPAPAVTVSEKEPESEKEITFSKKVISERDIIEANREGVKVIRVTSRNILTALAKDAAVTRNIRLIRE